MTVPEREERRLLFGAGAESNYKHVFPYSLFNGSVDPILELMREQIKQLGLKNVRDFDLALTEEREEP